MKYAAPLMDLMAAYPGRQFRMTELVNYVAGKYADHKEKKQVRMGLWRVLKDLEASGHIEVEAQEGRGASARYAWKPRFRDTGKVQHENSHSVTQSATLGAG